MLNKIPPVALLLVICQLLAWHPPVKSNHLKAIEIAVSMPTNFSKDSPDIKVNYMNDTLLKISADSFTLYKLSPVTEFVSGKHIRGSEPYFIYKNGAASGYYFRSVNDTSQGRKMAVDSFLTKYSRESNADLTPPDSIWALHETVKNSTKSTLLEKYHVVGKFAESKPENEMIFDSIYYYYSKKLNNINYTFSKTLDSARGMKLYKISLIYNSKFSSGYKMVLPKRAFNMEIREVPVNDPDTVLAFIKRFQARHA